LPEPPAPEWSWGGVRGPIRGGQEKRHVRIAWLRLSARSPRFKSELKISLFQPCSLERLIDVSPLAPDGLWNLSGAHSFLAQRHDACAVETDRATLVNSLRFRGVDAGALPITDEAKLISATMPSTVKTMRPIGPPVSMAGSSTRRLAPFSSSSWTRLRTSRVLLSKRSNLMLLGSSRAMRRSAFHLRRRRATPGLSPSSCQPHVVALRGATVTGKGTKRHSRAPGLAGDLRPAGRAYNEAGASGFPVAT
jgi:hypothetical protein